MVRRGLLVAGLVAAGLLGGAAAGFGAGFGASVGPTGVAAANPDNRDLVCGAYRLGVPHEEIYRRLQAHDGRITPQQAWRDTNWAIIDGECD